MRSFIILANLILCCAFVHPASAVIVFSEDFGDLPDGETITTSNTNFDYVRVGSQGGGITAKNPSSFSSGASMSIGGASGGSLNGVGLTSGLGSLNLLSLSLSFHTTNASLGNLVITTGTGDTFSNNNQFNTTQLFFGVQLNEGALEYRTSSWNSTGFTVANDTNYDLEIIANATGSTFNYSLGSVEDGTMDIVINDTIVANNVALTNNQLADGFRIYQVQGEQFYEIDNIAIAAIPEASAFLLGGLVCGLIGVVYAGRTFLSRRGRADHADELAAT